MNEITLATDRNRPIRESASNVGLVTEKTRSMRTIHGIIYKHTLLIFYLNPDGPVSL